jgi:hypothetical protein
VGPNRPTLPPEIVEHAGGTVVTWYFPLEPLFDETFPGVERSGNNYKVDVNLTFHSTAQAGRKPDAIAWVNTTGVSDIPFAWDADVRVFRIQSLAAGGTEVEAYAIKTEQRKLAGTISGDYAAIGNSLMSDENHDSAHVRERVYSESSANASGIPQDAEVAAAYLYWSGWIQGTVEYPAARNCCGITLTILITTTATTSWMGAGRPAAAPGSYTTGRSGGTTPTVAKKRAT